MYRRCRNGIILLRSRGLILEMVGDPKLIGRSDIDTKVKFFSFIGPLKREEEEKTLLMKKNHLRNDRKQFQTGGSRRLDSIRKNPICCWLEVEQGPFF